MMRTKCAVCSTVFDSLIIDPEVAWREVYTKLLEHCTKKHPNKVKEIQELTTKMQLIIVGYVTISELAILEDPLHPWLEKHLEDMQVKIMAAAGFDPEEEEEDNEEDEEEIQDSEVTTEDKELTTASNGCVVPPEAPESTES